MLREGKVVSRAALFDHMYSGTDFPESRTTDVFICRLRKRLRKAGCPDVIGTVRGHGFTFRKLAAPEAGEAA
jgi:two-component system cell cycle response regulator CtrA